MRGIYNVKAMRERVIGILFRYNMLKPGERVGVAVSGGADSVCLLHLLHELSAELGISLCVLHLNHGLRGPESDADEGFVAKLAAEFGLPFRCERTSLHSEGGNLEEAGRLARQAFFLRMREGGVCDKIATGHTRSDQAETVLYRLLRGSGVTGLSGIRPVTSDGRIRPLLWITAEETRRYLQDKGQRWREDATNADPRFARNRIRHELLPHLERNFNPAATELLAATAELAQDEEEFWAARIGELSRRIFVRKDDAILFRASDLAGRCRAEARRLVRAAAQSIKGDLRAIDFRHTERLLALAAQSEGHGRVQLPGLDVFRSFEWLRFARIRTTTREERDYEFGIEVPGRVHLPGTQVVVELKFLDLRSSKQDYNERNLLDADCVTGPLAIRNWRPGDAIVLSSGPERIKSLFQQRRIPIWDRQGWPMLTGEGTILWTRHFGVSAGFAASPGSECAVEVSEAVQEESSESNASALASLY